MNLSYVPTHEQLADIMTKPLSKDKFNYLKDLNTGYELGGMLNRIVRKNDKPYKYDKPHF